MTIIIVMFFICHVPKVILTGYEITYYGTEQPAATWAVVLKETSHILLVCYSAFNPIAYCGDLVIRQIRASCCPSSDTNGNVNNGSEAVQMKTYGVVSTVQDLDVQSRLLAVGGTTNLDLV